jgi:hypothetical protein
MKNVRAHSDRYFEYKEGQYTVEKKKETQDLRRKKIGVAKWVEKSKTHHVCASRFSLPFPT